MPASEVIPAPIQRVPGKSLKLDGGAQSLSYVCIATNEAPRDISFDATCKVIRTG